MDEEAASLILPPKLSGTISQRGPDRDKGDSIHVKWMT
jgi:hypothetical protein